MCSTRRSDGNEWLSWIKIGDRSTSTGQLRPLASSVRFPNRQPIGVDVPDLVRPVPDTEVRISDRAAQDRLDRERIVLGTEQAGHLGQVASNGQAVRGDEEDCDGHGHTGCRLEGQNKGDVKRASEHRRD